MKYVQERFEEKETWAGLGALLFALEQFLRGAGTTTPEVLGEASQAATQVGEAVASGVHPVVAIGTAVTGVLMTIFRTRPAR